MKRISNSTRNRRAIYTFALLAGGILASAAPLATASASDAPGDVRVQNTTPAQLIFGCDRQTKDLSALFTPELIADLKALKAGVAISTEDFGPDRAQIVRQLNAAGIPMTAWIVLPREQGYYVNVTNAPQTAARFAEFDKWTTDNGLRWQAVGLDIEPTLNEFGALPGHKWQLASVVLRRAFDAGRVQRARDAYSALIRQMQARGYFVQTYQLSFIADERNAHSTLLERIFGVVDVRGNEEVLMLYSSFSRQAGAGLIWLYGPDTQTVAVGSTAPSGDVTFDTQYPPLNWHEFSRDLIVARHFSPVVGVYSLEGCVRQGFIPRLKTMDWNQPVVIPAEMIKKTRLFRNGVHAAFWIASHLLYLVAAFLLAAVWLVRQIVRRRRRKRAERLAGVRAA